MAGSEGVENDDGHSFDIDAAARPLAPDSNKDAGGEGSSTTIKHLVTDLKHQITSATSQALSSALEHLEQKQSPADSSTARSGSEEGLGDGDAVAAPPPLPLPTDSDKTAAGEEGLSATITHFVTDLKHQIKSATSHVFSSAPQDKEQPPSEPEITSRGVSESFPGLTVQRKPKINFNVNDSEEDSSGK